MKFIDGIDKNDTCALLHIFMLTVVIPLNDVFVANRIKAVLAEKQRTNRWLAEQMSKSENTISRWCSNKSQPSIAQLQEIANLLDVDIRVLLKSQKE